MDTKKLRQKILDLAIRGKLVPQDPNDEPASVLLERIRAEKEQFIKAGKIKRGKQTISDKPHYENKPFDIPENWEWCNVEDFTFDLQYGTSEKSQAKGLVCVLRMGNITRCGTIDYTDLVYSSNESDIAKYSLQYDDLLFNRTNSSEWVGKTAIYKAEKSAIYAGYLIRMRTIGVCPDYVNFVMNSSYHRDWCNQVKTDAVNQSNINAQKLAKFHVPIPPLAEQKQIVIEVQNWFSLIDNLEEKKKDLLVFINQAKSKILSLAIGGRIVKQDSSDEPALELLKRINPTFSPCDTSHYENLPNGWAVCKIQDIADIISGVSYNKADITQNGIRIIRGGNIQDGKIVDCLDDVYIDVKYKNESNTIHIGDIVMVASTGSQTLIGKTGYANKEYPNTQIGAFLRIIRAKEAQLAKFLDYIFCSEDFKMHIRKLASGTNINNIKNNYVLDYEVSIPPLAEIHRIISKVDNVFSIIHSITKDLL